MTIEDKNIAPLSAIILKELSAGRPVEITGGMVANIRTMEEYLQKKDRTDGLFGEIISWRLDRTALIATRKIPLWAYQIFEAHMWEAPEMERWKVKK